MKKLVSTLTAILGISTLAAQDVVVKGPDEKLQLAVFVQNETKPCYSVSYNGKTMLEKSPLGMNTNIGDFTKNLKLTGHSVDKIDTVYQQTRIKVSNVHYRANELTCHLENEQGQKLGVIFRVSDNDVAFRYTLPHQGGKASVTVKEEQTGFRFPEQTTTFLCPQSDAMIGWKRTKPSYEEEYKADAQKLHDEVIEKIVETDDALLAKYFDGEEISIEELKKAIRNATISRKLTPVLCGSSYKNKGVQMLLDAMVEYLPSPLDIDHIEGINPETGEKETRAPSDDAPFAGLAFKIMTDPFVGRLAFFRVYSGKLTAGSYVYNSNKGEKERVGRLIRMHANQREEIKEVGAGDIAAIVGLKDTITGHTLCDEKHPIQLESMNFPEPVIQLAIEPKTKDMQEKMALALAKLSREDPSFRVSTNNETGQTLIAGMGELHLEIIVDRLLREFKVEANVGQPQVSYRETITRPVKAEGKYIRQSGGKGQYGHCLIEMEPLERGAGYEFVDKTVGGSIPKEYIQPINNGIKEAKMCGVLAGYETVDFRVTVYDGSFHEVDSSEMAFKIAGSMAFKDGATKAGPVLLEPIMKVTVEVPDEYLGTVMGNLTSRRGILLGNDTIPGVQRINAEVPLAEMFGYATDLRSQTQGRGTFVMEPLKYQEVPKSITDKIVGERAKK